MIEENIKIHKLFFYSQVFTNIILVWIGMLSHQRDDSLHENAKGDVLSR